MNEINYKSYLDNDDNWYKNIWLESYFNASELRTRYETKEEYELRQKATKRDTMINQILEK